jgi:NADH-quinone oxidoreductase subunit G
MASIIVDGRRHEADPAQNLLHACLSLGYDLPYFCWHPAMGSVGACRQCAVKQFHDEKDEHGRLVMACMTPAADGMRISIEDPEAKAFRASVIEWLMTNHPHDCPVCEEGGECHLQDMTVMTGHSYRRYRFRKRTFRNQELGPFINHEMNRCIACYRCVRFYQDYAGGRDLDVFAAHNHVYFGRHADGVLENEFSGNLVEVCPTGVFTDKTLGEFYNRKWDMRGAPSVCVHCGLGCSTIANERTGKVRRIVNRYNGAVNGYFLCDRGRFGYGFVNSEARILRAQLRRGEGKPEPVAAPAAIEHAAGLVAAGKAIGIGSPRASLEANFALRALVGAERFHLGVSAREHRLLDLILEILHEGPAPAGSLREAEDADAVLVLGEDVPDTAPRLALSLRQSVRQRSLVIADRLKIGRWQDAAVREAAGAERSPLFVATPDATRLDDVAARTHRAAPDDLARLGLAIAHAIDAEAPAVPDLDGDAAALARDIAGALGKAERPLIVSGTGCASEAVIAAAAAVAWALRRAGRAAALHLAVPECNSLGLAMMGGGALADAFAAIETGAAETVLVLENDLHRRAEPEAVERCLAPAPHLVVLDHLMTATARAAELALPAGTFAEADGTLVSSEGRAQRFFQLLAPTAGEVQESWRWLRDIAEAAGRAQGPPWLCLDDVTAACAAAIPALAPIVRSAPGAGYRVAGSKIHREPHRFSGRTAIHAAETVHEPQPPDDPDTALSFSMEGYYGAIPPALIPYFWAPSWNSVQSVNKFQQEIGGPLRGGDPGIRLIEPRPDATARYRREVPRAFAARPGEWLFLPLYEIFGSEELSRLAPAVAERVPAPYLALNPEDAARLRVAAGDTAAVTIAGTTRRLPVALHPSLPAGIAGLPAGLVGPLGALLPGWGTLGSDAAEPRHG